MQSQRKYGSFSSKSDLHGTILYTKCLPKIAKRVKTMVKLEQFAISRWSALNRGKQLWDVWDHVESINIKSSFQEENKNVSLDF